MKSGSVAPSAASGRFPFIDVLRGLAVLFMMETHTVNALLDPDLRRGLFYQSLTFVNGLVAPSFLFCAGLGFAIFLGRRNESVITFGGSFRDYARKSLFIVFLGYSLHVPVYSLSAMASADSSVWVQFCQVDILQVIGVSLLLLLLAAALLRTRRRRIIGVSAFTAVTLAYSVVLSGGAYPDLPAWVLAYLSREISPLFTLLPWTAFLTCGYLAGELFVSSSSAGREKVFIARVAYGSVLALAAALAVSGVTFSFYPGDEYWRSGVEFFVVRLSLILLVMAVLWRIFTARRESGASPLFLFGRESLPVYYFHLMIVYGKDFRFSYVRMFSQEMNYAECLGLTMVLSGLMWGFAYAWNRLKKSRPSVALAVVRVVVAASVAAFLVS